MIRQICNVKPEDVATIRLNELLAQHEIDDLNVILKEKRLRWVRHVERPAIKTVCDKQIDGKWARAAHLAQDVMEDTDRERPS